MIAAEVGFFLLVFGAALWSALWQAYADDITATQLVLLYLGSSLGLLIAASGMIIAIYTLYTMPGS